MDNANVKAHIHHALVYSERVIIYKIMCNMGQIQIGLFLDPLLRRKGTVWNSTSTSLHALIAITVLPKRVELVAKSYTVRPQYSAETVKVTMATTSVCTVFLWELWK